MSDQRIQYDEEMVGAGHPTKTDTLNRLALVEANSEGKGKYRYLTKQTADPSTGTDEGVLYAKEDGGVLKPYFRRANDGEVVEVGGGITLKKAPTLLYVNVTSAGTFDVTVAPCDTTRSGIIMAETISGGYSAFFNPYLDGYWTLLNSTVARFTCTYLFGAGRQVEGYLYELASGKAFEVSQLLNMTTGIVGTETTVASYDYANAFALPRDTYQVQATGFKWNVYPYSSTQVRWVHVAQGGISKTGYATVFAKA